MYQELPKKYSRFNKEYIPKWNKYFPPQFTSNNDHNDNNEGEYIENIETIEKRVILHEYYSSAFSHPHLILMSPE